MKDRPNTGDLLNKNNVDYSCCYYYYHLLIIIKIILVFNFLSQDHSSWPHHEAHKDLLSEGKELPWVPTHQLSASILPSSNFSAISASSKAKIKQIY